MAGRSPTRAGMTLRDFLDWPRIDRRPYLEFLEGRIEAKVSPQARHSVLEFEIADSLNAVARPARLGRAFVELRCTFAGLSIIPDVTFLLEMHIEVEKNGEYKDEVTRPPDIHVEVRSPGQSIKKTREKLEHSIRNGCPLGWFFDPAKKTIDVFRPNLPPERLQADGFLDGSPVLPQFRVAVAEVFAWLIHREPDEGNAGANPA